ncbi:hypothetical protein [Granulicella sp. dw_53]|uniref:hypothetical protein n=1 Tax=Granulicella sp. dw_53 TaxID=2719792 RepID=UPI001BD24B66|nr:hypothetical protein [Granulicella sp. dw_53]
MPPEEVVPASAKPYSQRMHRVFLSLPHGLLGVTALFLRNKFTAMLLSLRLDRWLNVTACLFAVHVVLICLCLGLFLPLVASLSMLAALCGAQSYVILRERARW